MAGQSASSSSLPGDHTGLYISVPHKSLKGLKDLFYKRFVGFEEAFLKRLYRGRSLSQEGHRGRI
jgi:hypothetical protein